MSQALSAKGQAAAWLSACRPKTLTAAVVPLVVGTALAKSAGYGVNWTVVGYGLATALCLQIGTNFVNDALDFKKGADTNERLGPYRMAQAGLFSARTIHWVGLFFFFLAFLLALPLIWQGGEAIFFLVVVALFSGYLYTGGPYPLAYCGLGDLFVFLFFGLAATVATYYLHVGVFSNLAFLAGVQIGLLATALIAINNARDLLSDAKANKRTLAVHFGLFFARCELSFLLLLPFFLNAVWWYSGERLAALLPCCVLPLAVQLLFCLWKEEPSSRYNAFLGRAALTHLSFGFLLAFGLLLA